MPSLRDRWLQFVRSLPRRETSPEGVSDARASLIDRKAAVQAEAAQIRREIGRLRSGNAKPGREIDLEAQLERLNAEERRLRLEIDQTRDRRALP
jgi:hypothetical protein